MTIGNRLRRLRQASGLTLEETGKRVGVSRQTIQRYESGEISGIPSDAIEIMASLYETTPAYIMGWETEAPSAGLSPTTPDTIKKVPGEGDIDAMVEDILSDLKDGQSDTLMLDGKPASAEALYYLRESIRANLEHAKKMNEEKGKGG